MVWTLGELYKAFGGEEKNGFKVLHPSVRIIQGDGISLETYPVLLDAVQAAGFSVTNVVVGSGGGLLQKVNRDTIRFAIKANYAVVDGEERAVQKETAGKKSKRGRLTVELEDGEYKTYQSGQGRIGTAQDLLGEGRCGTWPARPYTRSLRCQSQSWAPCQQSTDLEQTGRVQ